MQITINIPSLTEDELTQMTEQFCRSGWPCTEDVFSDAIRQCLNVGSPMSSDTMRKKWQYRSSDTLRPEITTIIS